MARSLDGQCTLACSRILDDTEIMIALSLRSLPRADYITVDANLGPDGAKLTNLFELKSDYSFKRRADRRAVKVPLSAHAMAIFRQT